uniref:Peptidase S1 domain-containing protein n=1 Tax=Biomphalaria glabrata TaxID=6526 RepID=A0A2C9KU18_BIOGL
MSSEGGQKNPVRRDAAAKELLHIRRYPRALQACLPDAAGFAIGFIDEPRKRIVNGQDAQLFDIPSLVALYRRNGGSWELFCGAVLIASNKVLTAAHCANRIATSDLRAVFGFLNYFGPPTGYEQVVSISKINVHEDDWDIDGIRIYDIAVLTLATPVRPIKNVKVAKLADKIDGYVNTYCIMSGWGYTNQTLMVEPNRLQKAITMIISSTKCKDIWSGLADALDEFFVCVYNEKGNSP